MALLCPLRVQWMISGRGSVSLYNHERNALRWRRNSTADRGTVSDMGIGDGIQALRSQLISLPYLYQARS